MDFTDHTFRNTTVDLDENKFFNCKFYNCTLAYSGGQPPDLIGNEFHGHNKWSFTDAAGRTLQFMILLYSVDPDLMEKTFQSIGEQSGKVGDIVIH